MPPWPRKADVRHAVHVGDEIRGVVGTWGCRRVRRGIPDGRVWTRKARMSLHAVHLPSVWPRMPPKRYSCCGWLLLGAKATTRGKVLLMPIELYKISIKWNTCRCQYTQDFGAVNLDRKHKLSGLRSAKTRAACSGPCRKTASITGWQEQLTLNRHGSDLILNTRWKGGPLAYKPAQAFAWPGQA